MASTLVENILESLLKDATNETIVHLKYTAGREASYDAMVQANQAKDWNKPSNEYVGHFESLRRTKKGDLLLTLFVHNRGDSGQFRAFNPSLGTLQDIRVIG